MIKEPGWVSIDEFGIAHVTSEKSQAEEYGVAMPLSSESMSRADDLLKYVPDVVRHDLGAKDVKDEY
jgi:hypothetical protein